MGFTVKVYGSYMVDDHPFIFMIPTINEEYVKFSKRARELPAL